MVGGTPGIVKIWYFLQYKFSFRNLERLVREEIDKEENKIRDRQRSELDLLKTTLHNETEDEEEKLR